MIKFFRHIRQQLLSEGKTAKYLKYAVGEILLVMIGILLAIQVNNWNEGIKERRFEQKMLRELQASLQNNIEYLDNAIKQNEEARESSQLILDYFESGLPYNDTLDYHFSKSLFWFYPSLDNSAYESLKSYGLHLISDDSIRELLGDIYEWKFIERISIRQDEYFYGTIAPLIVDWFESHNFFGPMKPLDYEVLSKSTEYQHILRTMISNRAAQIRLYDLGRQDRLHLVGMIDDELINK